MNGKCTIVALAILVVVGVASVKSKRRLLRFTTGMTGSVTEPGIPVANSETQASRPKLGEDVIDIDDQNDGQAAELTATTSDDEDLSEDGSGSGMGDGTDEDDEDMVAGSGRGSTYSPDVVVDRLTPCQQLRKSSLHLKDSYVPRCTKTGEYRKLQCRATTECFCVDPQGSIIDGTSKIGEMTDIRRQPDCDGGNNLMPCVHMRVEAFWKQYIAYSPSCTSSGEFKTVQCDKHNCWCVDHLGMEMGNSRVTSPSKPDCTASTSVIRGGHPTEMPKEKSTKKNHKHKNKKHKTGHVYDPSVDIDMTWQPPYTYDDTLDHDDDDDVDDEMDFDENTSLEPGDSKAQKTPTTIMAQPGILAGIIGGAVVGLLCAILLIMFIVYRMRKKDEGSYALDEPTKARGAYAYQKAPSKEFYA